MTDTIYNYIKGEHGERLGVIAGTINNGVIVTGIAMTNLASGDKFDIDVGLNIALKRARGEASTPRVSRKLRRQVKDGIRDFQIRCLRYFKDHTFTQTAPIGPAIG